MISKCGVHKIHVDIRFKSFNNKQLHISFFFSHFFGVSNTHIILQNGHVIKIREKLIRFRDRSVTKLKNFVIDLSKNGYLLHFF